MTSTNPQEYAQGQPVFIRGAAEIAATLDVDGKLDGLPFMPEMARFCRTQARVHRHADKTCVEGAGFRRLGGTILLEDLRCDGSAHDGCQRGCLFFWKEAWLRADGPVAPSGAPDAAFPVDLPTRREDRYVCQSTELLAASRPLSRWDLSHFFLEIRRGELTVPDFLRIFLGTTFNRFLHLLGRRPAGALAGSRRSTPAGDLGLLPGDWVEVLSGPEIRATLDAEGKNRGLTFEPGMSEHAGKRFQVDQPLERIILEETGKMVHLAHTVSLKGVTCRGVCSKNCPRNNILYWRESWLKRA
ncbi:hypothetical protein [Geothrix fermentans]|uniref:hypothetical protein n=1 Tax=Geothrix fermentans TaxID=44676 RepID=UPI0012F8E900|nr:hypothetical protein [Geothrix fermentans]